MKRTLAIVASLLLASAARATNDALPWVLSGCAQVHGGSVKLGICASCAFEYESTASFTAPVQGTIALSLDWQAAGNNMFSQLTISTPAGTVYSLGTPPGQQGWCTTSSCTGSVPLISAHLLAGEKLLIQLADEETICFSGSDSTSCLFSDIEFFPDVGFVTGAGALDTRLLASVDGPAQQSTFGLAVASPGDLDGDGLADIVGSADAPCCPATVRAYSSATGALLFAWTEPPGNAEYGAALASPGDVDGDGVGDILVGNEASPQADVVLLSGADGHVTLTLHGGPGEEWFGHAVAAMGDLDLDGIPDLLVGVALADVPALSAGTARVYSGADGSVLVEAHGSAGDQLGRGVASPGDIDGDGLPDIAAGAVGADSFGDNRGAVRLFSGAAGAQLAELAGPPTVYNFGDTLAAAGDLDGDGVGDILASDGFASIGFSGTGHVRAWSGATHALLFERTGAADDHLGISIAAAGDWDGDGLGDVLAGGSYADDGKGNLWVLAGPSGRVLDTLTPNVPLAVPSQLFGSALAVGGDVDGDGRSDFIVGALHAQVGGLFSVGRVYALSGDPADYVPPSLSGTGPLLPNSPLALDFTDGPPGAAVVLVVGLSKANLPLKGGLLVPAANALVPLVLDGTGALQLATQWPAGIPSGTNVWMQEWAPQSAALHGFVASAALQIIAP